MVKTPGAFLKEARLRANLSQGQVAKELGYTTYQYISDWERNRYKVPLDKIKSLAKILEIHPKELLLICYPEIKNIIK